MKTYFATMLVFVALSFASIGQAFASGSPGFSVTSSCDYIQYGICGPAIITVASLNGFTGTVSLSTSIHPYCTKCTLTASMYPSSVTVASGGNATSLLRLVARCQEMNYCLWLVNITGTSGTISNSTEVVLCVRVTVCPH
jgi:hypothetical protein